MKTKRGAQPGNDNAYKHGFYSASYKADEARLLDESQASDLSAEIELIRVMNMRYLESLKASSEPLDAETQLSALRAVTLSVQAITGLLRLQNLRLSRDTTVDEMLEKLASFPEAKQDDLNTPL